MSLFDQCPYKPAIRLVWLRVLWIFSATMIVPPFLYHSGMPVAWVCFASGVLSLPACISTPRNLGIKFPAGRDIWIVLATTLVIWILSSIASKYWRLFLETRGFELQEKQDVAKVISNEKNMLEMMILFVSICIITPIVEEVFFRRLIYNWWLTLHPATAFLGTSLLFSSVHFFILGIPGLFIIGCGFQFLFLYRKNLVCAMLSHMLVNSLAFVMNCSF